MKNSVIVILIILLLLSVTFSVLQTLKLNKAKEVLQEQNDLLLLQHKILEMFLGPMDLEENEINHYEHEHRGMDINTFPRSDDSIDNGVDMMIMEQEIKEKGYLGNEG